MLPWLCTPPWTSEKKTTKRRKLPSWRHPQSKRTLHNTGVGAVAYPNMDCRVIAGKTLWCAGPHGKQRVLGGSGRVRSPERKRRGGEEAKTTQRFGTCMLLQKYILFAWLCPNSRVRDSGLTEDEAASRQGSIAALYSHFDVDSDQSLGTALLFCFIFAAVVKPPVIRTIAVQALMNSKT